MFKKPTLLYLFLSLACYCRAGELELVWVKKILNLAPHNAFTDLTIHNGKWFCVFREGSSHAPGSNGTIRIIQSSDGEFWSNAGVISEKGVDLRDPKISVTPEGRLMILMGGSIYEGEESPGRRKLISARTRVSFSTNGTDWTSPQPVSIPDNNWLWRVSWHKGVGYGFSYNTGVPLEKMKITLWRTKDGINYEKIVSPQTPTNCYPDEATIRFLSDDTMIALVRNDCDIGPAYIGISKPPYEQWRFINSGKPVQGPNFIIVDNMMVYSGRDFAPGPCTVVGFMTTEKCTPVINLPSRGDTSYPGIVWYNNHLWVSYYSTHEDRTSIYLAKLRIKK